MNFVSAIVLSVALGITTTVLTAAESFHDLNPFMVVPTDCLTKNDFSQAGELDPKIFQAVQETQWKITNGVLYGMESTKEYQAEKPDHNGTAPRIDLPITPVHYLATFSIRFIGGTPDKNTPVMQFGHHIAHLRLLPTGTELLGARESMRVAAAMDYKLVDSEWYHVMVEVKGEEVVVQFANGPLLYGKHPSYAVVPKSGKRNLGFAGAVGGVIEMDDVTMWAISDEEKAGWPERRAQIPVFEHVNLKAPKGKRGTEDK